MPVSKVADSWALLAWLLNQPAASAVESFIQEAGNLRLFMSWMNIAEVYYIAAKRHGVKRAEEFLSRLPSLPIRLVLPDEEGIMAAARIKAANPVAFGDAFAIALAQAQQASVITGDDEIRQCGIVVVGIGSVQQSP
ncbi:MAG TPA: type II toxin-antitoxin system VapC family toxin [Bryobacteraceae bacterium]